ncbi:helix-turn-helix domain-containing protein [uncultured Nostoc sp.]|jgi:DNA-binding Lrp family transcriptional regulator|uniref:helix-turn-helix domain-containing protein n=1 Tax=uncultured Nostoc sp. TaxID=340711 RepID=UPI0035CB829F
MSKSTHYPLTHDEFLRLNAELKDAELRVYLYLMTLNPFPNSVMEIDTAQLSERLGITRRTVQRAVKQLQELQLIEIEITKFKYKKAVHGASSRLGSDDTRIVSSDIRIANGDTQIVSSDIRIANGDTQIATTPLKPLPNNDSSSPQINKINKTYLDSLSDSERESFLDFGKKKAAQLPNPPQLPQRWIEKNFDELRSQWYKSTGKVSPAQSSKWENDPRTADWLAIIEETANPLEFATDKEKQDFIRWCNETKQFSWLRGES